jgi:hypothetical protein
MAHGPADAGDQAYSKVIAAAHETCRPSTQWVLRFACLHE